ncbi:hypothetical protein L5D93_09255 [Paenibacillus thiaminolyticus]|nr:hypothetical protein [Paenibacillus thiaminolyticus]
MEKSSLLKHAGQAAIFIDLLWRFRRQPSRVIHAPAAWSMAPSPFRPANAAKLQEFFWVQNPRRSILQIYINFTPFQFGQR